ncbi:phosphate ABC transporter substrate-binding protein PstS [Ideonella sp. BN130291]|uniref:phosphate ABC transporter substrate-binding protein PstS n=1 Tax=Ideonella sp. BN130291 TaxID=3112940 RepID=UPI002E25A7D5|nr:phosphate ABC transporter substrate-binding protein PstS [Ideonella sp. BN130291]
MTRGTRAARAARGMAAGLLAAACAGPAWADVLGAGASFPSLVYQRWGETFARTSGTPVRYTATGSGDGVKKISARVVSFGGSDSPLPEEELNKRRLVQIPMLVGGIVAVVNLPGIGPNRLQLSGDVLALIMAGKLQHWNDPRIAAFNPGTALPALPIRRVVRNEKSGTTEGFTRYLAGVSPAFAAEVGVHQLPQWPGEVARADGNDGVVRLLKSTPGAIAYVSHDRAEGDQLASVKLRNAAGRWVAAGEEGFRAAILESDLSRRGDDIAPLMDRPGPATWPITMTSFVLVDAAPAQAEQAGPALRFLYWCFMHGDELTRGTGFAPIPVSLQSRLVARFAKVKGQDGKLPAYLSM